MNNNCLLEEARKKVNCYSKNHPSSGCCCGFREQVPSGITGPTGPQGIQGPTGPTGSTATY